MFPRLVFAVTAFVLISSTASAQGIVPLIVIMAQQKKFAEMQQRQIAADRQEVARHLNADRALRERELQLRAIELKLRAEAQAIEHERQRHLDGLRSTYPDRTWDTSSPSYAVPSPDSGAHAEIDGVAFSQTADDVIADDTAATQQAAHQPAYSNQQPVKYKKGKPRRGGGRR
ncbi:MAG: hypothetical protein ACK54F_05670 [Planctomycetia bacterium]|jgi:hypothetical protein